MKNGKTIYVGYTTLDQHNKNETHKNIRIAYSNDHLLTPF